MRAVFRIDPETEPDQNTFLLFKRGETTWKKEYIARRAREKSVLWITLAHPSLTKSHTVAGLGLDPLSSRIPLFGRPFILCF